MSEELVPCKRCKCIPKVVEFSGLFYVQCDGKSCSKWLPYQFLGGTRRAAIQSWNYANTHKTLEMED